MLLPRAADGSYSVDAPMFSAALMELGALVCTARSPRCDECPLTDCRWVRRPAGSFRTTSQDPEIRGHRSSGAGLLLDVLRDSNDPVPRGSLDVVWTTDTAQRDRALDSLLSDGLVEITKAGLFCLAGEADIR